VNSLIEVFVHSKSVYMDVDFAREMSTHALCDPDTATRASELFSSRLKGRILSEGDSAVLQRLSEAIKLTNEEPKIYDVSHMRDKLKALSSGIRRTPAVVINGEKYEGVEKCLDALGKHCSKQL